MSTGDLFLNRELSQWHTPPRLVTRVVRDLVGARAFGKHVVEPSAGAGAFVDELLKVIGPDGKITAVEIDPRWAEFLRARYALEPRVVVVEGDYLRTSIKCDLVVGNPPYEEGLDTDFMSKALHDAGEFFYVLQTRVLHASERNDRVWARAALRALGICVRRPSFGGGSAKGDFCAFHVSRLEPGEVDPPCIIQRWTDDWSERWKR